MLVDLKIRDIWTKAQAEGLTTGYTGEIVITGLGTLTVVDGLITDFTPEAES